MMRPLCFVLMPFGIKADANGLNIDFDSVYRELIVPGIEAADMEPLRADQEMASGIVHKPMFERLIFCSYAVADLTTANANVFYELGARHAIRPWSTVLVFAEGGRLPFDLALERVLPYRLDALGRPTDIAAASDALAQRLHAAREAQTDSPVYQLVDGLPAPQIDRLNTDVFRNQVQYSVGVKKRLEAARNEGVEAIRAIERGLGRIGDLEAGVVIDVFLSYRAVRAWEDMIAFAERMSRPLASTVMVREQLGMALNRAGRRREAEALLTELIELRGPSSETCGILGRVYKDLWQDAVKREELLEAGAHLNKAIDTYLQGFEADWRDAYPGINAVTLMEVRQPPDPRRHEILPVVRYAVNRRLAARQADYWDQASKLELAVLGRDEKAAIEALGDMLASARERWELETTVNNLSLIREAREARGEELSWAKSAEERLQKRFAEWESLRRV